MKGILRKSMMAAAGALIMTAGISFAAFAATTKTTISNVSLSFDTSDIEIGSTARTIAVEAVGSSYYVVNDSGTASNMDSDQWMSGMTPRFKITIRPEDGYKFDTTAFKSSSYYSFKGSTVQFVSASGGTTSITLTVKMAKLAGDKADLGVSDLLWSEDSTRGEWTGADNAQKYMVKLYRGSVLLMSSETTSTAYDFAGYINSTGTYKFKVRAYAYGSYGEWDTSDELEVDNYNLSTYTRGASSGRWILDQTGWWYQNANGSYPYATWQFINSKWYYFNQYGYMVTGWIQTNGVWYYCGSDGAMYVNSMTPDGYRVDANGAWVQ